jgi:hypothetical protein
MTKETCLEHSGIAEAVKDIKEDVKTLFDKQSTMNSLLIGTLVTSVLSLLGIIGSFLLR